MKKAYTGHYSGTVRTPVLVLNDEGDAFSWPVYRSIDYAAEKGALFRSLVENNLNQALCPNTGASYDLAVPVAIHDSSQQRFALFVPQSLRHRCFDFKQELLDAFQKSSEMVPRYVSEFSIIFNAKEFESLSNSSHGINLDAERKQLAEVRERIDKERDQLNAAKQKNEDLRLALESERSQFNIEKRTLEVEKLNIEQQLIEQSQGYDKEPPVESTQIVTDDQFLEVLDDNEGFDLLDEASDFIEIEEDFDISPSRSGFPISSKAFVKNKKRSVQLINDEVVAIAESTPPIISGLSKGADFFIQMHEIENHSILSLMLAKLDAEGKIVHEISWPLDPTNNKHQAVIDKLRLNPRLRVGLYDTTGALSNGFKIQAPLASNLEWMLGKMKQSRPPSLKVIEKFIAKDFEKLGGMKHGFTFDSFETIESPSAAKLAAGIVGYWSNDDMISHLIENRSFPLHQFRRIQERVIRGATEFGIYLNEALRNRAVEIGVADSQRSLIQLMFANFAEVSVALRNNDLSPTEQWENWDSLLTTGEKLGIPPDSDVVELAETSLKRAQDFHDIQSEQPHTSTGSQLIRDIFEDYRIEESAEKKKEMRIPLSGNVEKVLPLLIRAVKTDGPLEKYAYLLVDLEEQEEGTIGTLLKDRSKRLRDVAKEARQIRKDTK